jgi:hypothetical protein
LKAISYKLKLCNLDTFQSNSTLKERGKNSSCSGSNEKLSAIIAELQAGAKVCETRAVEMSANLSDGACPQAQSQSSRPSKDFECAYAENLEDKQVVKILS